MGNAPIRSQLLFGRFSKYIGFSISIAEKVSNTLWVLPKKSPRLFWYFSHGHQELLGAFPYISQQRFGYFLYIYLEAVCFCLLGQKSKTRQKNFKTIIPSSLNYSGYSAYNQNMQTQFGFFSWLVLDPTFILNPVSLKSCEENNFIPNIQIFWTHLQNELMNLYITESMWNA
jgi:hypothetical protein